MSIISEQRTELLSPAQDWDSLRILGGVADAVYFGTHDFNMRAQAKNFDIEDLKKISEFCHKANPRMNAYLCTNILIYDSEIGDLENLISMAKEAEIDAVIAHDLAAIKIAKRHNINFHVSTQANISNIESARFYEELGAERIILARELSLNQIESIKNQLKHTKIECFVHGSMCTSISGRCYFSATICESEEFSANRGNCVQPCRRAWRVIDDEKNEFVYDGQLFFNSKDLCMIEYIPELINAKIDGFKIEGRMKDPLYIKTVSQCYREAIDCFYKETFTDERVRNWLKRLSNVYNRGFHTGFYFQRPSIKDIELEKRGNISDFKKKYIGKVLSYDKASKSANILIQNKEVYLNLGDKLIIIGKDKQYFETIKKIIIKGKKVESFIKKQNEKPITINIPLNNIISVNDKIYLITNK